MQERIAHQRASRHVRSPRAPLAVLLPLVYGGVAANAAELRSDPDYQAIVIEAESTEEKDDRWVLTEPDTPGLSPEEDPDGNHSDQAVGKAYLELLPDTRVKHEDTLILGENFWRGGGTGPVASWTVDFPQAGRYYVHVRALSTGTEDNGLFVGLDGQWPESGGRLQLCAAGRGWTWTSRQRDSGGAGSCGVDYTIWLEVPSAGPHQVQISAREDGFEIDRLMLIHDLSDNTRICSPSGADGISCKNGSIENADEAADVTLGMTSSADSATVGDEIEFTFDITNKDRFDTALAVELNIAFDTDSEWELVGADERCEPSGEGLQCVIGDMQTKAEENSEQIELTLRASAADLLQVAADIESASEDPVSDNDNAFLIIDTVPAAMPVELVVDMAVAGTLVNGAQTELSVEVGNVSGAVAEDVLLTVTASEQLTLEQLPAACQLASGAVRCEIGDVEMGQTERVSMQVRGERAGSASISALVTLPSDAGIQERLDREIQIVEPEVVEPDVVEPEVVEPDVVEPEREGPTPVTPTQPSPTATPEPTEPAPTESEPTESEPAAENTKRGGSGALSLYLLLALAGVGAVRRRPG